MAEEFPRLPEQLPTSAVRYVGKAVNRVEDPALVSGAAPFIDNLTLPGMLHCAILRSPHPHARIVKVDASAAEALEGVVAVLTPEDVKRWANAHVTAPPGWGTHCMAIDKVLYVGEPVAAVAAVSRHIAEDAIELIEVDYEVLPPVGAAPAAVEPDAPVLFEEHGSNVIQQRAYTWGEVDRVFAEADHVVSGSFRWNRCGSNPTETFGCVCQWDLTDNSLLCHGSYQVPSFWGLARALSLNLPSNKVKVVGHPQGGAFGGKGGARATDIAALLSRKADGRPVKYIEDRMECLLAGFSQSWDRYYEASLAFKADGTFTGLKVKLLDDQGATTEAYGTISVAKPLAAFTGNYRIEAAQYDTTLVVTNRAPAAPYRGYGPPPHFLVLENLVDMAARKLGMDPAEIRRINYIRPEQFPYTIPSGNEYDSGNYEAVLDKVLKLADYQALRKEQAAARAEGRLVGISVVNTVEPGVFDWNAYATVGVQGVGVPEGARVSFDILGNVTVVVGFNLQGQGQFTIAAQVVADYFGIDINAVKVTMAPTDSAPPHFGQGGSRLGVAVTGAVLGACRKLEADFKRVVGHLMGGLPPEEIELMDGRFRVKANPTVGMTVAEVAGTMLGRSDLLPPGMEPNPTATSVWTAPDRNVPDDQGRCRSYLTAANATHVVMVEVDRQTGRTEILKYFLVDDCGTRLNPANVEGQLQGAVAQGVGAALLEEYVYDEQANPLVTTFVDYLLPSIHEVPITKRDFIVTPSPVTPLGAKGCGEGAMHTTPAAVICAINDALAPLGVQVTETPATPLRVWKLLQQAGAVERSG
ncbi:MAG: xanthine dehydrogenase family protein molybdopterin-binding subunit [Steroidobacteraceae bacterium]|jgi:CO/xanthine dehydrogenase Mo-binding subunit|nr:xanthine dehydrogenase family protein molybdopterin-binding subunit [Steroidobacteraceae bacterium]